MNKYKELGNVLKAQRESKKLSAEEVANYVGVSYTHIYNIEKGVINPSPRISEIIAYAEILNMKFEDILFYARLIDRVEIEVESHNTEILENLKSKVEPVQGYFISKEDFQNILNPEENKIADFDSFLKAKNS
jgi:transcriptional regulator with XRE-family HTH domain